jgi:hypothetical protein
MSIEHARFNDFDLLGNRAEILTLCKDQYGCRFLQRKLEEKNEEHMQIIFEETNGAVVDLMIGTSHQATPDAFPH